MNFQVRVSPAVVAVVLGLAIVLLVVVDYTLQVIEWNRVGSLQKGYAWVDYPGGFERPENGPSRTFELIRQRFDFDRDGPTQTIPTWFSSFQFAFAGLLFLAVGARTRQLKRGSALPWAFLGLVMFYLSIDDTVTIHELLGGDESIGHDLNEVLGLTFINFDWVVPAAIAVLVLLPFYIPFGLRLPLGTLALFALAGLIFIGSQMGIETYSGNWLRSNNIDTLAYHRQSLAEDALKLVSELILIYGLLAYYRDNLSGELVRQQRTLLSLVPLGSRPRMSRPSPSS
ncbi:MAG TPA: hypothetical protein VNN10_09055 [Dehalococcoidia bacterium]|nr:hypothetical protein [Dehalococcoidia bacterium]